MANWQPNTQAQDGQVQAGRRDGYPLLVVGIGEALFDCFGNPTRPDRELRLGGAPLNFTVCAQQMMHQVGGQAALASRVGHDKLGDEICREVRRRGMEVESIQRDPRTATGLVQVQLAQDNSQPNYEITRDVAWDRLEFDDTWRDLAQRCGAVCFGTLAQRSSTSQAAIHSFLSTARRALRICDINLRQDYCSEAVIRKSLQLADVAKFSEEELELTSALMCIKRSGVMRETAQRLRDEFELSHLAVSRGDRGTLLVSPNGVLEGVAHSPPAEPAADGVGAGDACCAGLTVGLLLEWSDEDTLELANRAGALVAARAGGAPELSTDLLQWLRDTHEKYCLRQPGTVGS